MFNFISYLLLLKRKH